MKQLQIENPLGIEIEAELQVSNRQNYSVSVGGNQYETALSIPPYGTALFDLVYTPSALGSELETCDVIFDHPDAGVWLFQCEGTGSRPSEMDATNVSATVKQSSSNVIRFRNPLRLPIKVRVELLIDDKDKGGVMNHDAAPAFDLMMNRGEIFELSGFKELDIPIVFMPQKMLEHTCHVSPHRSCHPSPQSVCFSQCLSMHDR